MRAATRAAVAFATLRAALLILPATTLEAVYEVPVPGAFVGFPIALVVAALVVIEAARRRGLPMVKLRELSPLGVTPAEATRRALGLDPDLAEAHAPGASCGS